MRTKPTRTLGSRLRPLLFGAAVLLVFLGAVFLPGPRGALRLLAKKHRIDQLRHEMTEAARRIDSLEVLRRNLSDPEFALEYARLCLGDLPPDSVAAPPH